MANAIPSLGQIRSRTVAQRATSPQSLASLSALPAMQMDYAFVKHVDISAGGRGDNDIIHEFLGSLRLPAYLFHKQCSTAFPSTWWR